MRCQSKEVLRCLLLMLIISLFSLSGCSHPRAWTYKAEPYVKATPILNKSVSVAPLSDHRDNSNQNYVLLYLIPLMPFGWQELNTPEGINMHLASGLWQFKPAEDFAKAIAEELNNTSIFKEVFFTHRQSEADLTLKGKLISTKYSGYMFTYGLSVEGPLLWTFCFPSDYVSNELVLQLQLVDTKTDNILWEQSFNKEDSHIDIIYALQSDFMYDTLLKDIMKEAIPSIKNKLNKTGVSDVSTQTTQPISNKVQ